jgi:intracellular multiplication protein IcmK
MTFSNGRGILAASNDGIMGLMQVSMVRSAIVGTGMKTGLLMTVAMLALMVPAAAQDSAQQLPPDFAQEQIPNAFGDMNGDPQPAEQIPSNDSQATQAQDDGTMNAPAPEEPSQSAQSDMVQQPAENAVPAQPENQKLVPARAMGASAQTAQQNQTGNTVEEAAQAQFEAQQATNPLDQYTAAAEEAAAENPDGDALPQVNNLTMVTLETDMPGTATKRSRVAIDGSLDAEDNAALQAEIRREAFDAAITGMFPLTPDQIQSLMKKYDETQRAVQTPPSNPKPEVSVQTMSLDPGVAPPVIKTAVGNVTTLNILDATGAPWPVQDVTWAGDFEIVEPEEGGHIIRITPMGHFARGNMVIRMLTLKTPLTVTLETSRETVQYRVDARIPEYGPFAQTPLMQGGKSLVAGDSVLTGLLDGVAPGGMTKLSVSGVDGRTTAYSMGGTTYVRTPLTLLSPAWQSSVSSADGMNVYALNAAPVLLLSDGGEFARATLKEKEDLLDE